MKIKIDGLNELERLQENLAGLDGHHGVPFDELFPPAFMTEYTDFGTVDQMFAKSGFKVETSEDFERIPDAEWDTFIARTTRFATWQEMREAAVERWTRNRLAL